MNKKLEEKRNKERLARIVKLPENKKCFDCAGRGRTAYVVMPLWTFVCTGCSGVHREFSHRVLSITLHSFTKEQIDQLEAGGNSAAQARWLATWDSRDFPMPVRRAVSCCVIVLRYADALECTHRTPVTPGASRTTDRRRGSGSS